MHTKHNNKAPVRAGFTPAQHCRATARVAPTLVLIFILCTLQIYAQRPQTEFQITGNAGIPITLESGVSTSGFDGNAGVGITAFVSRNIGIHLGVGIGTMRRETNVGNLQTVTHGLIDVNNYIFDLHSTFSNYRENLHIARRFSIPLMLHFQQNSQGFYAKAGARFLLPVGDNRLNYDVSLATLQNAGYYVELGNWAETQPFAGFGTFNGNSMSNDFALQFSTALALEAGWKWQIGQNMFLYTGVFFDYWLSDFAKDYRQTPSDFSLPANLTSTNLINLDLFQYADRINPMTIGITLRLAFTRSDTPRASPRNQPLLCPPGQMRHNRSWDRPSPIFNHPTWR